MYIKNGVHLSLLIVGISLFFASSRFALAISYPYELPDKIEATLDVNTQVKIPLDHMLLGLGWGAPGYNGFNHSYSRDQVRTIQPSSIRFPSGVWSNFYDWEIDGYAIYDDYQGEFHDNVRNHPGWTPGFAGLNTVHNEIDFDVLFTWNVCYDSPVKSANRLLDHTNKGFDVKWIELGNENFYMSQRSNAIDTADKYVDVARAHSLALKAEDPTLRISVPAAWKNNGLHQAYGDSAPWNTYLTADTSYYDAISVHIYNRPGETEDGVKQCLDAGQFLLDALEPVNAMFPDKPVWLSEWSVDCGDNAISVLGMADVYLTVFNHTDIFEMTHYFQANGKMEPMFIFDSETQIYTKTSFGAGYEVIRSVFENSQMYDSVTTSADIIPGLAAVRAEAVLKDGQLKVFALNRTTKNASLTLKFNGVEYTDIANHQAFAFNDPNDFYLYGLEDPVLTTIAIGTTSIVLPPLSFNVISGLTINPDGPWDPYFYFDPLMKSPGEASIPYCDTLADSANDADPNESLTFSKVDGPNWLFVALTGELSGIPSDLDVGQNSFIVRVTDSTGRTDETTLLIDVLPESGLTKIENFQGYAPDTVMNNQISSGPLGGLWDADDEGTWHSTRAGKVIADGTNQVMLQEYRSSGKRAICINGLADPIDEGETGILFFRFKQLSTTSAVSFYGGVHTLTGSDPLTPADQDRKSDIAAGFHAVGSGSTFDIKTVDDSVTLITGLLHDQWYSAWLLADNGVDTYDLYIEEATDGAGGPGLPTTVAMGIGLPFNVSTTEALTGGLWHIQSGNSANYVIDEVWWHGGYTPDFLAPVGVGLEDFVHLASYWQRSDCSFVDNGNCFGVDLNHSGTVDIGDLQKMIDYWLGNAY